MDIIGKDDFDDAEKLPLPEPEKPTAAPGQKEITDEEFQALLIKMKNPVEAQKELAVQIKTFLDHQMKKEMSEKGYLSDFTRRWVSQYNDLLEKIQKSLYGDKSVNLHLVKVSHSDIAQKVRKYRDIKK